MSELTREGNPVLSHDALIRQHIKGNSESLCAKCKHVMDACADINRKATLVRGFHEIYWCEGFEIAPDNHTGTRNDC